MTESGSTTMTPPETSSTGQADAGSVTPMHSARGSSKAKLVSTLVLVPLALIVGISGFLALAKLKADPIRESPTVPTLRVVVFDVAPADFTPMLTGFGTAHAEQEVTISAEVAGRVDEVPNLKVGTRVRGPATVESASGRIQQPGEMLIRIAPDTYAARIEQVESQIAQAAVDLEQIDLAESNNRKLLTQKEQSLSSSKLQLALIQRLFEEGASRETDLRRAELDHQLVEASVLQLNIDLGGADIARKTVAARRETSYRELALAQLDLDRTRITAPFSGVISKVAVEVGQYVRPGEPLVQLTGLDRVEIALPIPVGRSRELVQLISGGARPAVELAEHEGAPARWQGTIVRIAPVADSNTRTLNLFAEVDNSDTTDPLMPGTFVHARIRSTSRTDTLLIPRAAIIDGTVLITRPGSPPSGDSTSENATFTETPAKPTRSVTERRTVTLGKTYRGLVEVVSGLEPGDHVILTNLDILQEGIEVEVVDHETVADEVARDRIPTLELQPAR